MTRTLFTHAMIGSVLSVKRVQQLGKPVWTTAGDAPRKELEKLIKYGVNGILSDFPEVLGPLLLEIKKARGL